MKKFKIRTKLKKLKFDISLSSPFMIRDVCIHCGSLPDRFTYSASKSVFKNHKIFQKDSCLADMHLSINYEIDKNLSIKGFCKNKYNNLLKYTITNKSFSIKAHKTKDNQFDNKDYYDLEIVICKCGMTTWGFVHNSVKNRPDIINKKSSKNYPRK